MAMDRSRRHFIPRALLLALLTSITLGGCVTQQKSHYASSVVEYLYPNVREPVVVPGVPVLKLPIRVGIAFVPTSGYQRTALVLTETKKTEILKTVATHFKKYPFVKDIEIIPSAYLRPRGGFTNLDQIRNMYGVDVIVLVSYDQVQFTDRGVASLVYWTIVGAYVVPAEKNSTHTMIDAVVYDIPSRKLLFRAPGTSNVRGRATPVNLSEMLREDSERGFNEAATEMTTNLDTQLALFKDKIRERPQEYRVVRTAEYRGGGSLDGIGLVMAGAMLGFLAWKRRRH
jgi:rhombotail lipoprotein